MQENVQIDCTGYVHIAAVWMMENNGCVYSLLNWVLWMWWCYETEFRSLMAWGKKLRRSISVFAIMLLKRLPDGSKQKWWLPGWVESLMIFSFLCIVARHELDRAKPGLGLPPPGAALAGSLPGPWSLVPEGSGRNLGHIARPGSQYHVAVTQPEL